MNSRSAWPRALTSVVGCLLVAACGDAAPVYSPETVDEEQLLEDLEVGYHPILRIADAISNERRTIELHVVGRGVEEQIASFQGEIAYDPAQVRIIDARFPDGVIGAWNPVGEGRVRVAMASLDGISGEPIVRFEVDAISAEIDGNSFSISVEEVAAAVALRPVTESVVVESSPLAVKGNPWVINR